MPQLEEGGVISRASACPYSRKRPTDRTCFGKGRESGGGGGGSVCDHSAPK